MCSYLFVIKILWTSLWSGAIYCIWAFFCFQWSLPRAASCHLWPICTSIYMQAPALCRLLIHALYLVRAEQNSSHVASFACSGSLFQMWMCSKSGHYRGFFIYAHYRSTQTSFIGAWGGDPTKWGGWSDFGGAGSGLFWHKFKPWSYIQMKVWWVIYRCTVLGCVMCCSGGIWPGGKNCSCVWLFWCIVLCSAG